MTATPGLTFDVTESEQGVRLDVTLAAWLEEPRSKAAERIARGDVLVDGRRAAKSHRLAVGERVDVAARDVHVIPSVTLPPIRYEDDHLLVVAKPADLVVHPGSGRSGGTLVDALREAGRELAPAAGRHRPGIVHRLDRDTSGLMVVAKTDEAYGGLTAALRAREVHRRYLALVEGVAPASAKVDVPLGRDPRHRTRFTADPAGRSAVTHLRTLARGAVPSVGGGTAKVTLLECTLATGRTHQIRVHVTYAGHPVVGDRHYGARRDVAAALGLRRLFLHAGRLGFTHPITGGTVDLVESLPDDLVAAATMAGVLDAAAEWTATA